VDHAERMGSQTARGFGYQNLGLANVRVPRLDSLKIYGLTQTTLVIMTGADSLGDALHAAPQAVQRPSESTSVQDD
jgi:hypothetical protein